MKKLIVAALIALTAFVAFPFKALAEETLPNIFSLEKGKVVTHNPYFAYGEEVALSGTVNGDTYVAGGKVRIDGNVNGDILIAGGDIEISGNVKEDVRIFGGQVNIKGKIGKNLSVVGGKVTVAETATVTGSFVVAGGDIEIQGPINDNVDIAGGSVKLNSRAAKDFDVVGGQISLGEKANVLGKFEYWSDTKPTIAQTAVIKGQVIEHQMPVKVEAEKQNFEDMKAGFAKMNAGSRVLGMLSLLAIGFIFIKISKKYMLKSNEVITTKFWKSLGLGFIFSCILPFAFVILLITLIGAPIAFITFVLSVILGYLAKIFVIAAIGAKVLPNKSLYLSYTLALVVYTILVAVPVLGAIINMVLMFTGVGAYLITKRDVISDFNK